MARPLRILTWHVHGNYLYYLTQVPHDWYVVVDEARSPEHIGLGIGGHLPWGPNVHEVQASDIAQLEFDAILYQSRQAWDVDRHALLNRAQREGPALYLEHDPPQQHPTDTRHWAGEDAGTVLVHVTPFNALMWDSGRARSVVIEHGVKLVNPARYDGRLPQGVVVVNNLDRRGRRLGADIYAEVARQVPLTLVGMGAERSGGLGEIDNDRLPAFVADYRFFFNPIRYTSLGLAIIEAMMVGLPVVGLATTELASVVRHGETGYIDTRIDPLVEIMKRLAHDRDEAQTVGAAGRRMALERFGIDRFVADWMRLLEDVAGA